MENILIKSYKNYKKVNGNFIFKQGVYEMERITSHFDKIKMVTNGDIEIDNIPMFLKECRVYVDVSCIKNF